MSSPTASTPPTSGALPEFPEEAPALPPAPPQPTTPPARLPAIPPAKSDLSREIQAIMAARREMGSDYDDHFADILAERLGAQIQREVDRQVGLVKKDKRLRPRGLSPEQRLGLAIPSLIFLIPLAAIGAGVAGLTGMALMCLLVLLLNIAAGFF